MTTHPITRAAALGDFVVAYQPQPFNWATHNCCHFASAWVQACEGTNPMPALPAQADALDVARAMRQHGDTLQAAITALLQRQPIATNLAQVGDLVLSRTLGSNGPAGEYLGLALGICAGRTAMHLDVHGAAVHLPVSQAVAAWRVNVPTAGEGA